MIPMVILGRGVFTSNMFLTMGNPWFSGPQLLEFSQMYMPLYPLQPPIQPHDLPAINDDNWTSQ